MRRVARWALGFGASMIAIATISGARADLRSIDLDECSTSCIPVATGSAGGVTLSLFSGGGTKDAKDARPDLILDPKALPPVLVSGLPSAIADVAAQTLDGEGVSPYAFFADVIDVPRSAGVPFFLFTASVTSRLSDFLWATNDFFGPPSGDIASRRAVPVPADFDALYGALYGGPRMQMQTRATPTQSSSPVSGPPSSGEAEPFAQVWDDSGRLAGFSSNGAESNK